MRNPSQAASIATGQQHPHLFAPDEIELEWDEPDVRAEVLGVMRFRLDFGASGFRLDALTPVSGRTTRRV